MTAPADRLAAVTGKTPPLFEAMRFRFEWRTYQRTILHEFESRDRSRRTFHVVAPPGSGKTLVGIEIARRIGRPAVTFAPTTTIQEQWRDKVRMFLPEGGEGLLADVSTDPANLGPLSCLTYQSLSTQTHAREFLDALGRRALLEELVQSGRTPEGAERHLADLEARAPEVAGKQIALRARRRKREVLASGEAQLRDLLHPNALDLVERIVAQGTGCLILDEAHHLLDYWAMIIAELIARMPDGVVVGLTATPPASAAPEEMGNYLALVDGIDFEVPTPAVVRSGHLAPYQDLVLITRPTAEEEEFLASQHELLEAALAKAFADPRFPAHVERRINRAGDPRPWTDLLAEEFDFAVAGVRYLVYQRIELGKDVEAVPEMREAPDLGDRLALVRDWCLSCLRFSTDPGDRETLDDARAALRTLGMVMTETGWRAAPSPLERVLAYSRSKVDGMVRILGREADSMGEDLRAVVLTDFEWSSAVSLRRLRGVLDPESGGAVQAVRALVADPRTSRLDPVMVTGRTVLVDADFARRFVQEARDFLAGAGLRATVSVSSAGDRLALVDGEGPGWAPRYYVALVTALFERGVTRCIVGTRGLLSEGWDSLSLNTLVDLTTAGTYASVNQIRGRSIRLDPAHPRKVANNWDLVCVAPRLSEGRLDLDRLIAKHRHIWGLGPNRRVVKGIAHVDLRLLFLRLTPMDALIGAASPDQAATPAEVNSRAFHRAGRRDRAYDEWGVGQPYQNFEFRGTILAPEDLRPRTAFTWKRSLRALLNVALATLAFFLLFFSQVPFRLAADGASNRVVLLVSAAVVVITLAVTAPLFWRYARAAFIDLPVDSYLGDFGRAVAEALREAGLAPASPDRVRVAETESGAYEVHLDTGTREAADLFAEAYRDLFLPIADQRYLVVREETTLSGTFYAPIWYTIRGLTRLLRRRRTFYHPVPDVFARNRELAETFARAWRRWVGGGTLVYTRSTEGASILLRERAAGRLRIPSATVEEWR